MEAKTLAVLTSVSVIAFIGFWLFLPFIVGAILLLVVLTIYKKYKPQTYVESTGKAIFITGCDSGFGNLLAQRLDKLGFQVFAGCLFAHKGGAVDLKSKCSKRLHLLTVDVTSDRQVSRALEYVKSNMMDNKLWAVVNNAGIAEVAPAEWSKIATYEKVMSINYMGTVRVSMAFLPLLRDSVGRLVNVSSLSGRSAIPGFGTYAPSKSAVISFSDILRREQKKFGVKVITVEPALYKTAISNVDSHTQRLSDLWNDLHDDVKSVYGQKHIDQFHKLLMKYSETGNPNIEEAIDCLADAVMVTDPPVRYIPNLSVAMKHYILSPLPTWVLDKLLSLVYG